MKRPTLPHASDVMDTFVPIDRIEEHQFTVHYGRERAYRGILRIEALEYHLLSPDEQGTLLAGFKRLLNGLTTPLQILIRTLPHELPDRALEGDYEHFLQELMTLRQLVQRSFYVILSEVQHPSTSSLLAQNALQSRLEDLRQQFSHLGLEAKVLDATALLRLLRSSLAALEPPLSPTLLETALDEEFPSLRPKSQRRTQRVRRHAHAELLAPASLEIAPHALLLSTESRQEYLRTYVATQYPHRVTGVWLNRLVQLNEPSVEISLFIEPLPTKKIERDLSRRAVEHRGAILFAKRQERTPDPLSTHALNEVETLRDKLLTGDEQVFAVSLFVLVRGASTKQALDERTERVQQAMHSLALRALPLHYQHHLGWLCCLPYGTNLLPRYSRMLSSSAVSTFFPFTTATPQMEQGVLFGVHPTNGQLIMVNPFDPVLPNANLSIFGQSGRGKSFFLKVALGRLAASCHIFILDPEGEYPRWATQQKAHVLSLNAQTLQINPLELHAPAEHSQEEWVTLMQEKLSDLMIFFSLLIGEQQHLTQKEKAVLYRCLLHTYEQAETTPSLRVVAEHLQKHSALGEELAERLAAHLHLFPDHTTLPLHHTHIVFDLQQVPKSLKPVATYLITEVLWKQLRLQRIRLQEGGGMPTIIALDEAWFLVEHPEGAQFLAELARRIRKYGGSLWLSTHRSGDFLQSEQGKTLLALSTIRVLFQQATSTMQEVSQTFQLSHGQQRFLHTARTGEALLFLNTTATPLEIVASAEEHTMATTTLTTPSTERNTV